MNESQLKWASNQDWYAGQGVDSESRVFVNAHDWYTINGVLEDGGIKTFTDYKELKEWAGY